jgi:hypothetical protein
MPAINEPRRGGMPNAAMTQPSATEVIQRVEKFASERGDTTISPSTIRHRMTQPPTTIRNELR